MGGVISARSSKIFIYRSEILNSNVRKSISNALQVNMSCDSIVATWRNLSCTVCFCGNRAHTSGGAMHILNSSVTIDGNISFNENSACKSGGALALNTANMEVREMHCTRNSALERGGAIGATRSTLNFTAWSTSLFCGNKASFDGGAISMVHWVNLVLSGSSVFLKNKAGYNGGGVCMFFIS